MKKYKVILNYKFAVEIKGEDETRATAYAMNAVDDAVQYCCSLNANVDIIERRTQEVSGIENMGDGVNGIKED